MSKKLKSLLLLKGEGINEHVLVADEIVTDNPEEPMFSAIRVGENGKLTHINPITKEVAEHNTIPVEPGIWIPCSQIEFNPFTRSISGIFD